MVAKWLLSAFLAFAPTPDVRTLDFAREHITNEFGRPYDHSAYPHLGAPGGPMDAFDDPTVRTTALQWATRLGKTFFGQVCSIKTAWCGPWPQMLASPVEELTKQVLQREYQILDNRPKLKSMLRFQSEKARKMTHVRYKNGAQVHGAWARSVRTLSDKTILFGRAIELPKWEYQSTSREAHPLKLFDDRFKDVLAISKRLYEGTPTISGRCPIEKLRGAGWNCQFFVPCPHCKNYQVLDLGKEDSAHGIKWTKTADGRNDPELARKTASYVCEHCHQHIDATKRAWMMRRGVWAPEGCGVDREAALRITEQSIIAGKPAWEWRGWATAEWVTGSPLNDGPNASYQLSSLYALSLDWGDVAAEFLRVKDFPPFLRNFVNQWLAKTWALIRQDMTWEQLGQRAIIDLPRGDCPAKTTHVVVGVDRQDEFYVWIVTAWRDGRRCHIVDYGICDEFDQAATLCDREFATVDGRRLKPSLVMLDTGFRASECYRLIKGKKKIMPLKGWSGLGGVYSIKKLSKNTSNPGLRVCFVDTNVTQDWLDQALQVTEDEPNRITLYSAPLADHEALLSQLLNEVPQASLTTTNHAREKWVRRDEAIPVDLRDGLRYAMVGFLIAGKRHAMATTKRIRANRVKLSDSAKPTLGQKVSLK